MIKTIMNCEDIAGCEVLFDKPIVSANTFGTEFEATFTSFQSPMESSDQENVSFSNEISIFESCPMIENRRKSNFLQRIRNLREECADGPLLASTEDLAETDDDSGFVVVHRSKRGRKVKEPNVKDESKASVDISSDPIHTTTEIDPCVSRLSAIDPMLSQNLLECLTVRYPDLKENEYQTLLQTAEKQLTNINKLSNDELYEELEKLREKQIKSEELDKSENAGKLPSKTAWCEVKAAQANRVLDFNECAVCLTPWDKDEKKILVECGHCFHSDCLRTWMKMKSTCPFCSTYSLSPDDFPKLA